MNLFTHKFMFNLNKKPSSSAIFPILSEIFLPRLAKDVLGKVLVNHVSDKHKKSTFESISNFLSCSCFDNILWIYKCPPKIPLGLAPPPKYFRIVHRLNVLQLAMLLHGWFTVWRWGNSSNTLPQHIQTINTVYQLNPGLITNGHQGDLRCIANKLQQDNQATISLGLNTIIRHGPQNASRCSTIIQNTTPSTGVWVELNISSQEKLCRQTEQHFSLWPRRSHKCWIPLYRWY